MTPHPPPFRRRSPTPTAAPATPAGPTAAGPTAPQGNSSPLSLERERGARGEQVDPAARRAIRLKLSSLLKRTRLTATALIPLAILLLLSAQATQVAQAHTLNPSATHALSGIGFSQHPGSAIPADLPFTDDTGRPVHLGDYFRTPQPVILTLNDLHCANLCPLELDGLINGLNGTPFTLGTQFTLLTVALNPDDTPDDAALTRARGLRAYVHPEGAQGWHVLTGDHATIDQLANAVGFDYAYDPANHDFAHPAGVVVLTPQGLISRYLYGFDFSANDLRLALVDATGNRIGSLVDRLALVCYHYDPVTGRYTPLVMQVLQIAAAVTVLVLGAGLFVLWRSAPLTSSTRREPPA